MQQLDKGRPFWLFKTPKPNMKKTSESPKSLISRRRFFGTMLFFAAALPVGRIAILKSMDHPLPKIASPEFAYIDGWVLDQQDIKSGETN